MRATLLFLPPLLVCLSLGASTAMADAIPPDEAACDGLNAGDSCAGGICRASTCNRIDYAHWDASPTPPTMTYDCLRCMGSADDAGAVDAGRPPANGGGCSSSGAASAGLWAIGLIPLAALALVRRARRDRTRG